MLAISSSLSILSLSGWVSLLPTSVAFTFALITHLVMTHSLSCDLIVSVNWCRGCNTLSAAVLLLIALFFLFFVICCFIFLIFEVFVLIILSLIFLVSVILELRVSSTHCLILIILIGSLVSRVTSSIHHRMLVAVILKVLTLPTDHCSYSTFICLQVITLVSWIWQSRLIITTISTSAFFFVSSIIQLIIFKRRTTSLSSV